MKRRNLTAQPLWGRLRPAAVVLSIACSISQTTAWAAGADTFDFVEAYSAALKHDATLRAARHEMEAAQLTVPVARSALLPSVNLQYNENRVEGNRTFSNSQNQEVRLPLDYKAPQTSLSLRAPVFNAEAREGLKLAQAQADLAESVFEVQGGELVDRLGVAYFQVLFAQEARRTAAILVESIAVQLEQAERRFDRGEGTRVQAVQLRSSLDVAKARELDAEDQLNAAQRGLQRLTGMSATPRHDLTALLEARPLVPQAMDDWMTLAVARSPLLKARQQSLLASGLEVRRERAGHLPRLDVVGSVARNENESVNNVGQSTQTRSIGVQLTVPIFAGGGVVASVERARAREARARELVREEREALEMDVQRLYRSTINGFERIKASQRAAASSELAWQAARRSLELGLGTLSEVAEARAVHFTARRDLAQAQVDHITARVRLMLRAGAATDDVALEVAALLAGQSAQRTGAKP